MRIFCLTFFILFALIGFSQVEPFRKNTLSLESGMFHRGIVGFSYSRNFFEKERMFLSQEVYAGIGHPGYRNYYAGLGLIANFGKKDIFFSAGLDLKYCYVLYKGFVYDLNSYFSGITCSPIIGLSVYEPNGFTFKAKVGVLPLYSGNQIDFILPFIGGSIGYSF